MEAATVVNREIADRYVWGQGCDGWRLLDTPACAVIEERMPPNTSEVRHFHQAATQTFYILSGKLRIEVDDTIYQLDQGDALPVYPRRAHQVRNESDDDVRFLVISAPATTDDRHPV